MVAADRAHAVHLERGEPLPTDCEAESRPDKTLASSKGSIAWRTASASSSCSGDNEPGAVTGATGQEHMPGVVVQPAVAEVAAAMCAAERAFHATEVAGTGVAEPCLALAISASCRDCASAGS